MPGRTLASATRCWLLKSRSYPGRVRAILETLLGQLSPFLEQSAADALDAFEQSLFRRAEQARNDDEQRRCLERLREVRRSRSDIAPALMAPLRSRRRSPASTTHADSRAWRRRNAPAAVNLPWS